MPTHRNPDYRRVAHPKPQVKKSQNDFAGALLASGTVDEKTFDRVVDPMSMTGNGVGGA